MYYICARYSCNICDHPNLWRPYSLISSLAASAASLFSLIIFFIYSMSSSFPLGITVIHGLVMGSISRLALAHSLTTTPNPATRDYSRGIFSRNISTGYPAKG